MSWYNVVKWTRSDNVALPSMGDSISRELVLPSVGAYINPRNHLKN